MAIFVAHDMRQLATILFISILVVANFPVGFGGNWLNNAEEVSIQNTQIPKAADESIVSDFYIYTAFSSIQVKQLAIAPSLNQLNTEAIPAFPSKEILVPPPNFN